MVDLCGWDVDLCAVRADFSFFFLLWWIRRRFLADPVVVCGDGAVFCVVVGNGVSGGRGNNNGNSGTFGFFTELGVNSAMADSPFLSGGFCSINFTSPFSPPRNPLVKPCNSFLNPSSDDGGGGFSCS
ncbi:unnamed protein product [Fraxinus pennsylvanica]|uniref:Uncharacterized protein n=1 Tax=Fraxinus pennsylvanica TaxID=56036 RepID=A0AAD1YKW8_9LAMI|nr:unnamed protein product [Fraxinus pennsylvanica]